MSDTLEQVSVESPDGRILTGVGTTSEALQETVEARSPESAPEPVSDAAAAPVPERTESGQFKPKESKGQKRFQELASERDTYRGQAESAQARAERAERELADLRRQPKSEPVAQAAPEPTVAERPRPSEDEVGSKYPTYGDFVEDLADWKAEKRILKAEQQFASLVSERIEADRAQQSLASHVSTITTRGREAYADFDTVLKQSDVVFSPDHLRVILSAPHSEHVQYALASDRALAERIAAMDDPFLLGLEFAKLQPASTPTPRAVSPASTPGVSSKAPAPYQPVGTGTKTTSPPLEELAAAGDYDAYKARRDSQLRAVARR